MAEAQRKDTAKEESLVLESADAQQDAFKSSSHPLVKSMLANCTPHISGIYLNGPLSSLLTAAGTMPPPTSLTVILEAEESGAATSSINLCAGANNAHVASCAHPRPRRRARQHLPRASCRLTSCAARTGLAWARRSAARPAHSACSRSSGEASGDGRGGEG